MVVCLKGFVFVFILKMIFFCVWSLLIWRFCVLIWFWLFCRWLCWGWVILLCFCLLKYWINVIFRMVCVCLKSWVWLLLMNRLVFINWCCLVVSFCSCLLIYVWCVWCWKCKNMVVCVRWWLLCLCFLFRICVNVWWINSRYWMKNIVVFMIKSLIFLCLWICGIILVSSKRCFFLMFFVVCVVLIILIICVCVNGRIFIFSCVRWWKNLVFWLIVNWWSIVKFILCCWLVYFFILVWKMLINKNILVYVMCVFLFFLVLVYLKNCLNG